MSPLRHSAETAVPNKPESGANSRRKLSKTQMRNLVLRSDRSSSADSAELLFQCLPHQRQTRAYRAMLDKARKIDPDNAPQDWTTPFLSAGIHLQTLIRQGVCYLADPEEIGKQLRQEFSRPSLTSCGLLDGEGLFRFTRHRVLIPFPESEDRGYFLAIDPEVGFQEILSPTSRWPSYFAVDPELNDGPVNRLYMTTEVDTALRLGALGYRAWAVQSADAISPAVLGELKDQEVIFCQGRERLTSSRLTPYVERLDTYCRRFSWQSLAQVETAWMLIHSRQERGQLVEEKLTPHHPWINRLTEAFQRRKKKWIKILAK